MLLEARSRGECNVITFVFVVLACDTLEASGWEGNPIVVVSIDNVQPRPSSAHVREVFKACPS